MMNSSTQNTPDSRSTRKINALWSWLIVTLVILGSVRGIIVINSDLPVDAVYLPVAASLLILAMYGYIQRTRFRSYDLIPLRNLLKLNLVLGIIFLVIDYRLSGPTLIGYVYVFIGPYAVFALLRMRARYLNVIIIIITMAISYSILADFIDILGGARGIEKVYEYNVRLRPETFAALSHTEGIYAAGGYTGSYRDSANILGMAVSFFFIRYLVGKKVLDLGLSLVAMLGIVLTQSAANIAVAIFTILIFAGYLLYLRRNISTLVYLVLAAAGIVGLIAGFGNALTAFAGRLGEKGDWQGMLDFLDVNIVSELPFIVIGHGNAFSASLSGTEVAHLIIISNLGILHAMLLFWIMLYPLFRLVKMKVICLDALPPAAAVFFGFMSLLHYNSVWKVTSIFLFYVFYAMCLDGVISWRNALHLTASSNVRRALRPLEV